MSVERFTLYGSKLEHGTAVHCSVIEHKALPDSLFHSMFFCKSELFITSLLMWKILFRNLCAELSETCFNN